LNFPATRFLLLSEKRNFFELQIAKREVSLSAKSRTFAKKKEPTAILTLICYDPFPVPKSVSENRLTKRRTMDWSLEASAKVVGVDPGIWRNWERGQTILYRKHSKRVACFLGISATYLSSKMSERWKQSHN